MKGHTGRMRWCGVSVVVAPLVVALCTASAAPVAPSIPSSQSSHVAAYAHLPLAFEENRGQSDTATRYLAHGAGFTLAVTADALLLAPSAQHSADRLASVPPPAPLRFAFLDANPTPPISSSDPLPGIVNYFIGNDPAQWRTNIPTAGQVRYHDLYPGIDLTVYGTQNEQWEYDVVVAPGADPAAFGVAISGTENVRLENGELVIGAGSAQVRQRTPALYQEVRGTRHAVTGSYTIRQDGSVGFAVGEYDHRLPLVIDPVSEIYGTYLGGSGDDKGYGIAVDSADNVYLTGTTTSTNFPTIIPVQASNGGGTDAFVTKINASGTALIYSTYFGGSGDDNGTAIAVGSEGDAYITGYTTSTNFPIKNPCQATFGGGIDAFVTEIDATGNTLGYSTYLGGSGNDQGIAIAVDSVSNAHVTGSTNSTDFPLKNPIEASLHGSRFDAFAAKLSAVGSDLIYSTYLGGTGTDGGRGIAVDSTGNAYLTGTTNSTNFSLQNPIQAALGGPGATNAFVTKINAAGSDLVYSTYLGGSGTDFGSAITVDSGGNVYLTGTTNSPNFPTVNPIQASGGGGTNAFVTKINAAGSAIVYSTYLGGSNGDDYGTGIAVDSGGNAYVAGAVASTNFPTKNAIQPSLGGSRDAFVTEINAAGNALAYSTYLGGAGYDTGQGIAVDGNGNAYVTGLTGSTNFPTKSPLQVTNGGSYDAYVVKIGVTGVPPPTPTGLHVTGATNNSVTWGWTNPDATAPLIFTVDGTHFYGLAAGTTTFTLYGIAYGSYGCMALAAYNAYGASSYTPYSCSYVVPYTPYSPHFTSATTTTISFAWSTFDPYSSIGAFDGTTFHALGVNASGYTATGVQPGYYACIAVVAYNVSYASPYSPYACGLALPAMPTNVHVTGHTGNSVSFAWTNHDPYSGIALTNDGVHLLNEGINATSYTQMGMASGQYACIEIAAYNSSGASAYTTWVCGQAG